MPRQCRPAGKRALAFRVVIGASFRVFVTIVPIVKYLSNILWRTMRDKGGQQSANLLTSMNMRERKRTSAAVFYALSRLKQGFDSPWERQAAIFPTVFA